MNTPEISMEQISSYLEGLVKPYSELTVRSASQLKIVKNDINLALLKALDIKGYISSITLEKAKIKVNRRRS